MVTKGTNVLFKFNKVIKIFKKFINPERKILDEKYIKDFQNVIRISAKEELGLDQLKENITVSETQVPVLGVVTVA